MEIHDLPNKLIVIKVDDWVCFSHDPDQVFHDHGINNGKFLSSHSSGTYSYRSGKYLHTNEKLKIVILMEITKNTKPFLTKRLCSNCHKELPEETYIKLSNTIALLDKL